MKLRSKTYAIFVCVAVIPLLILTLFAYSRYHFITLQRMNEIADTMMANAVTHTDNLLNSVKQTAGFFNFYSDSKYSTIENLRLFSDEKEGYDPYKQFQANENIKYLCQNALYANEYLYGIYIFTPSGAVLGHNSGLNGDLRPGYQPFSDIWYKKTMELDGSYYVSPVHVHSMFTGKKKSFFLAQCLKDVYTHTFLGVLLLQYDPALLDLSVVNTLPGIAMLAVENTDSDAVLYSNIDELPARFPGKRNRVYHQSLCLSPLRLTAVLDYDAFYKEFRLTGLLLVLVAVICIIGILFVSLLLSRSLIYPIEHLSRKMASQKGNRLELTSRYQDRTDEIGTLYNEYNSMVQELNTSIKHDYQDRLIALDAQMKSLEARINSHFLFNTLESINSIAELNDDEQIATMSLALGNMFRYTIKTPSELVTVADELTHVHDYVSIQTIRFSNRFRLVEEIDPGIRGEMVLKLILQPLVENALFHGLSYCSTGDLICVRGVREGDVLLLSVEDNGQGMSAAQLGELQEKLLEKPSFTELGRRSRQSIGLKNIQSRIELYYGHGYGLQVQSTPGAGTRIQIRIPVIQNT